MGWAVGNWQADRVNVTEYTKNIWADRENIFCVCFDIYGMEI